MKTILLLTGILIALTSCMGLDAPLFERSPLPKTAFDNISGPWVSRDKTAMLTIEDRATIRRLSLHSATGSALYAEPVFTMDGSLVALNSPEHTIRTLPETVISDESGTTIPDCLQPEQDNPRYQISILTQEKQDITLTPFLTEDILFLAQKGRVTVDIQDLNGGKGSSRNAFVTNSLSRREINAVLRAESRHTQHFQRPNPEKAARNGPHNFQGVWQNGPHLLLIVQEQASALVTVHQPDGEIFDVQAQLIPRTPVTIYAIAPHSQRFLKPDRDRPCRPMRPEGEPLSEEDSQPAPATPPLPTLPLLAPADMAPFYPINRDYGFFMPVGDGRFLLTNRFAPDALSVLMESGKLPIVVQNFQHTLNWQALSPADFDQLLHQSLAGATLYRKISDFGPAARGQRRSSRPRRW